MQIQLTFFITHIYVILREKLFKIHFSNVLSGVLSFFLHKNINLKKIGSPSFKTQI